MSVAIYKMKNQSESGGWKLNKWGGVSAPDSNNCFPRMPIFSVQIIIIGLSHIVISANSYNPQSINMHGNGTF